jgi:hypothetical protein
VLYPNEKCSDLFCSPFLFSAKSTVTGVVYLDMLEEFLLQILVEECFNDLQDRAPRNLYIAVGTRLTGSKVSMEMDWQRLPYSPDLTPLDIIFGGYIKDSVSFPPLFTTLLELARRICAAVSTATPIKLEYRHDVCQATGGALIEHL